jgi:glycine/D-amino acid oxidase-like deaminating enzyme
LKKRDAAQRVVVLEGEIIGFGASGRNAGWMMNQFGADAATVKSVYGTERTREAIRYCQAGVDYSSQIIAEHKMDCDFRDSGLMKIALGKNMLPALEKYKAFRDEMQVGEPSQWLDSSALQLEMQSPMFEAAVYDPNVKQINPCKLVREWKRIAIEAGVEIYENTPVVSFEKSSGKIRLRTIYSNVTADHLVLATNAFSHLLGGSIGQKIKRDQMPAFPVMHVTEKLTPEQWQQVVSKSYQCPIETATTLFHGYSPTADGRLVLFYFNDVRISTDQSMRAHEFDMRNRDVCLKHFEAIFPSLKGLRIEQSWGGPVSMTLDMIPHIGYIDEQVILASGCQAHGVALGQQNGRTISELIFNESTERTDTWFVKRKSKSWPGLGVGALAFKGMIGLMKLEDRWAIKKSPLAPLAGYKGE